MNIVKRQVHLQQHNKRPYQRPTNRPNQRGVQETLRQRLKPFPNNKQIRQKTLIIYCYFENEETKNNLQFFLNNGVINSNECKYAFIINNNKCTVDFPPSNNIKVFNRKENDNDLCTYKWFIHKMGNVYFSEYSRIYFINSSCIGPFISPCCSLNWIDIFNEMLKENELIGPVIEIPPDNLGFKALGISSNKNIPFIHSYMFGVNSRGFSIIKKVFKNIDNNDKNYAVCNTERKLTSSVLINGGRVKSCLARYKNIDLNKEENWNFNKWNTQNALTCYEITKNYFGIDLNPFEIIFVKNIRNTNETRIKENSGISNDLFLYIEKYKKWL